MFLIKILRFEKYFYKNIILNIFRKEFGQMLKKNWWKSLKNNFQNLIFSASYSSKYSDLKKNLEKHFSEKCLENFFWSDVGKFWCNSLKNNFQNFHHTFLPPDQHENRIFPKNSQNIFFSKKMLLFDEKHTFLRNALIQRETCRSDTF